MAIKNKTNIIFFQILAVGVGLIVVFSRFGFFLYQKLFLLGKSLMIRLEEICGCSNPFASASHPYFSVFLIILSLGLVAFLVFGLNRVVRLVKSTRKFIKINLHDRKNYLSPKLKEVALSLGVVDKVVETSDENPSVFCYGIVRPKICIASSVVKKLNQAELRAVLKHEWHHLAAILPLKLFIIQILSKFFFFIPGLNYLKSQFVIASEIDADNFATDNFKDKLPLASALYKIIKWREAAKFKNSLAVSFFAATTAERIQKLADDNYIPKVKIIIPQFLVSVALLSGLLFYAGGLISSGKLLKTNTNLLCPDMGGVKISQCHKSDEKSDCSMEYKHEGSSCTEKDKYV